VECSAVRARRAARPLRRRLCAFDDDEGRMLADHVDGFLAAVHS